MFYRTYRRRRNPTLDPIVNLNTDFRLCGLSVIVPRAISRMRGVNGKKTSPICKIQRC